MTGIVSAADMTRFRRIVVLTGSGLSAESGIATFRDKDGVWSKYEIEDVATPQAFARNPKLVHDFYNQRRRALANVKPNDAHRALARLETEHPGQVLIVTQNVDHLHSAAGSRNLIHMHGELLKALCNLCGERTPWHDDLTSAIPCPACNKCAGMRPDVVWFGEMPYYTDEIDATLEEADLFISIGTSGNVYPAASYVARARANGAHTVELNLEPSLGARHFAEAIHGPATLVVPEYVARLLGEIA